MMKLFELAKKYKNATYDYPFGPYEVPEGFRGKPEYDYEKCIACGACAIACPSNAIEVKVDEKKAVAVWQICYGRCIFCARCDEVCPTGAIRLSPEYELSVLFNKDDLIVKGEVHFITCERCGSYFTTERIFNYGIERLKAAGWDEKTIKQKTRIMKLCPECRKKESVKRNIKQFNISTR